MSDIEQTKQRLELLKMARTLLNEEYINRRAEDHNKWLAECDESWRTRRIKLPYPSFAPYPSEAEIVAKALTLYGFVNPDHNKVADDTVPLSKKEADVVAQIVKSKNEMVYKHQIASPWETYLNPDTSVAPVASVPHVPQVTTVSDAIAVPVPNTEGPTVLPEKIVTNTVADSTPKIAEDTEEAAPATNTFSASMKNIIPNFWRQRESDGEK